MPEIEEHLGMSMQTYAEWLSEKNLDADNMSNRLMYIDYIEQRDRAHKKSSISERL